MFITVSGNILFFFNRNIVTTSAVSSTTWGRCLFCPSVSYPHDESKESEWPLGLGDVTYVLQEISLSPSPRPVQWPCIASERYRQHTGH